MGNTDMIPNIEGMEFVPKKFDLVVMQFAVQIALGRHCDITVDVWRDAILQAVASLFGTKEQSEQFAESAVQACMMSKEELDELFTIMSRDSLRALLRLG